jgi:predicted DNA-binding protein
MSPEEVRQALVEAQLTPMQRLARDLTAEKEGPTKMEVSLNLRVSSELTDSIDRLGERFGVSRSELVRRVLESAVDELARSYVTETNQCVLVPEDAS